MPWGRALLEGLDHGARAPVAASACQARRLGQCRARCCAAGCAHCHSSWAASSTPCFFSAENSLTSPPPACSRAIDSALAPSAAVELVGLGQQHQELQALLRRAGGSRRAGSRRARSGRGAGRTAAPRRAGSRASPGSCAITCCQRSLSCLGHGRVAVAGQVGQHGVGRRPACRARTG